MKNLILLCLTLITASAFGQAIKPKMMIVPSDAWMTENGFVTEEDEDGAIQKTFEYAEAFQNDPILVGIINKVGGLFAERGFNLNDMAQEIKGIQAKIERNKIAGRNISALDELALAVAPDIYMYLDFKIADAGMGRKQVSRFSLTAIDSYSKQTVANAGDAGPPNSGVESDLVAERVLAYINEVENDIMGVFEKYTTQGRMVTVEFQVSDDVIDYECWDLYGTEINGEMLIDYLTIFAEERSIGAANVMASSSGETVTVEMSIPLKSAKGRAMKAQTIALQALRDSGLKTLYKMRPDEQGLGYCIVNVTECK